MFSTFQTEDLMPFAWESKLFSPTLSIIWFRTKIERDGENDCDSPGMYTYRNSKQQIDIEKWANMLTFKKLRQN